MRTAFVEQDGILMIFLFGERISIKLLDQGHFYCPVCGDTQQYQRLSEVNYFTIFLLPIAPLSRLADYYQCGLCRSSFDPDDPSAPAYLAGIRRVLVYIMMGYNMVDRKDTTRALWQQLTGKTMDDSEIAKEMKVINESGEDIFNFMKSQAFHLNLQGKEKIIEAAFLMTYACCEIEHEDRLRVNLIGSALGVPLEFVEAIVNRIRASNYYGIKRNLIVS